MAASYFQHVAHWVFDLDNTLYPPSARLFDQIEARMTAWVMEALDLSEEEADHLRASYWARHGTTLAGLIENHGIDAEAYLEDVHDISLDALDPAPDLARALGALPGRRIVYTNGSRGHAERVLAARGLSGLFDAVYGVEDARFRPKPERAAFEAIFAASGIDPARAAMFEDEPRNLEAPHAMGMRTVHVAPAPHPAPHIHHHTEDLAGFLSQLT
ncbi:MAG: pyrimidine 5'-nucleotidase [Pseudomonadota bacterium]